MARNGSASIEVLINKSRFFIFGWLSSKLHRDGEKKLFRKVCLSEKASIMEPDI